MLKKGITIIATGHPEYGRLAFNLTLSIKAVEPIPVAVICTDFAISHLNDKQKNVFDYIINLPMEYRSGFGTKLHLDQLTPFDKTLALDADMLWLAMKKPSALFEELKDTSFSIITEGDSLKPNPKYYFWADVKEIQKEYAVDKVYQCRSEVIYFDKSTKIFKIARELKPEKKLKTIRKFGEAIPDELYFNIAIAKAAVEPHVSLWQPAYWCRLHGEVMPPLSQLSTQYFLLSFGSNAASPVMKKTYDNLMQYCANKLGMPYLFKLKSKKEWAHDRLKI
jgi:hypothetical protein